MRVTNNELACPRFAITGLLASFSEVKCDKVLFSIVDTGIRQKVANFLEANLVNFKVEYGVIA